MVSTLLLIFGLGNFSLLLWEALHKKSVDKIVTIIHEHIACPFEGPLKGPDPHDMCPLLADLNSEQIKEFSKPNDTDCQHLTNCMWKKCDSDRKAAGHLI